ncbi:protein maelstrom homolog isoform X4 [Hypanus sabinus]|uniref:protein maelstrom homolog isoform X4 n=1 Tax=Hypanus sabinus TaxID=79690 RepID=UPI0028C4AFCE|nr:protein maelstrom homolog isoform X4 [Hypanus sabinus]
MGNKASFLERETICTFLGDELPQLAPAAARSRRHSRLCRLVVRAEAVHPQPACGSTLDAAGMPRRKPARNAYHFFMLEKIPELRQRGIEVRGLKDAVPLCGSEWESLNESEKEKYVQMAHQWKAEKEKMVNKSEKNEQLQNPMHLAATREMNSPPMICFSDKEVCDEVFHFISFLSLADLPSNCEQRFLPCEMACVKYSMKKGIIDEFHCFIDPGMIPYGFRYHCQLSSDSTHKIPLSNFEIARSNYCEIFQQFLAFLKPVRSNGFIPVYSKLAECFRVNWCLNWLARKSGRSSIPVNVFEIEELVMKLYEYKLKEKPSKDSVERMLNVMVWDYAMNTRCKWHDEHDIVYCALATTKKYAYCISDSLSSIYKFEITAAHIPKREFTYGTILNPKVLVLDHSCQQTKVPENLTSHYFHSPSDRISSGVMKDEQN